MADNNIIKKLDELEARLDADIAKIKSQSTITMIVGGVLTLIIVIYLSILGGQIQQMLNPKDLVEIASTEVIQFIPKVRTEVEKNAEKMIPEGINRVVDTVLDDIIPYLRKTGQEEIDFHVNGMLDRSETLAIDFTRDALTNMGPELREKVDQLSTEEGRKVVEDDFFAEFEANLMRGTNLGDLDVYADGLENMQKALVYLAEPNPEHTEADRLLREILMVARELINRSPGAEAIVNPELFN